MRTLTGVVWLLLGTVGLAVSPPSAQATGTGDPVIVNPTAGSTVGVGFRLVAVDFSDAPVGQWTVSVLRRIGPVLSSAAYTFDGTNANAAVDIPALTSPGEYRARVTRADGTTAAENGFVVAAAPAAPTDPRVTTGSQRGTLTWGNPDDDGGSSVVGYQVQLAGDVATRQSLGAGARSRTFRGLTNGRTYSFLVRARNTVGYGPWASAEAIPAGRPSAPATPHARVSSHRATLAWGYPSDGNGGAAIDSYQVQRGAGASTRRTLRPDVRSQVFTGLRYGRTYQLYVRAHNRVGYGPWARASARPRGAAPPATGHSPAHRCTPGYSPCLPPAPDYDCAGGSGNGPRYVEGPVRVTGSDPYDLDRDGDGIACED